MSANFFTVLGGSGFIGGALVEYLRQSGHKCFSPGRGELDVALENLGNVVYCIGLTSDFRSRPLDTVEAHVCMVRKVLERGNFESLTYLSSTRVYAGAKSTNESAPLMVNPNLSGDLYNLSKLMGESLCLHAGISPTRVVRLSNVIGVRPDANAFVDQLLAQGNEAGHLVLGTSLSSSKDYLYIDDAVKALAQIASSSFQGILNLASGESVTNQTIVEALKEKMGFSYEVSDAAQSWDFEPMDIGVLRAEFDFQPRLFDSYFPEFLEKYRNTRRLA